MLFEDLLYWLSNVARALGMPIGASLALWAANELYYRAMGLYRRKAVLSTGLVGVPVHETAHALTALLFGMKVKEIAFYRPDPESNTLGYVNYLYSPRSLVHRVGMVATGLAPLIVGAYIVVGLFTLAGINNLHDYPGHSSLSILSPSSWAVVAEWWRDAVPQAASMLGIVSIALALMVGTHSTPSKADLKGVLAGIIGIFTLLLAFWAISGPVEMLAPGVIVKVETQVAAATSHISTAIIQMAALSGAFSVVVAAASLVVIKAVGLRHRAKLDRQAYGDTVEQDAPSFETSP